MEFLIGTNCCNIYSWAACVYPGAFLLVQKWTLVVAVVPTIQLKLIENLYLLLHGFILLSNNSARVSLSDLRTNILYIKFNTSEFLLVKDILLLVPAIETVSWKCLTQQRHSIFIVFRNKHHRIVTFNILHSHTMTFYSSTY